MEKHKEIAPKEELELFYQSDALPEGFESENVEEIQEAFYKILSNKKDKEIERMYNRLAKSGQDTAAVSYKLKSLKTD